MIQTFAMEISTDGREGLIDYTVAEAESEGAWGEFLRGLYRKGFEGKATVPGA